MTALRMNAMKKTAGTKKRAAKASAAPLVSDGKTSDKPALILDAALDLFRQYGYRRTSMEDIAQAANVAKGTLYIYFKSKDELFEALARRLAAQIETNVEAVATRKLDFEESVLALLEAKLGFIFNWVSSSPHAAELTGPTARLPDDVFGPLDARFRASLAGALLEGEKIGKVDLKAAGLTINEAVDTLVAAAHGAEVGASDQAAFDSRLQRIARLTLRGLR